MSNFNMEWELWYYQVNKKSRMSTIIYVFCLQFRTPLEVLSVFSSDWVLACMPIFNFEPTTPLDILLLHDNLYF